MAAVSQLTLTGAELLGGLDLLNILTGTDGLQQSKSGRGLGDGSVGESSGCNDEGNLRDGGDLVAAGEEKGGAGRCSNGGSSGETPGVIVLVLLSLVNSESSAIDAHFWPRLIFWCHFLHTLVGANMRPERHMLPKAA